MQEKKTLTFKPHPPLHIDYRQVALQYVWLAGKVPSAHIANVGLADRLTDMKATATVDHRRNQANYIARTVKNFKIAGTVSFLAKGLAQSEGGHISTCPCFLQAFCGLSNYLQKPSKTTPGKCNHCLEASFFRDKFSPYLLPGDPKKSCQIPWTWCKADVAATPSSRAAESEEASLWFLWNTQLHQRLFPSRLY